jgi:aminopeptidase N
LRNACLDLMVATGNAEADARAVHQYESADNMTDRLAALSALTLNNRPERAAALDEFYRRYAGDPLIVDKWLSLQAMIPEAQTLDRVRALTGHAAFSFANPNRIRALIGTFAQANHTQFNRPDGAGHDFVVDTVLALDPRNPQVAARLLSAFKSWRALEASRRQHAEAALRRITAAEGVSADVLDIARRALGES